jgi:prevent-host-death family protein
MSASINIYDAKTHLSALVERAAAGEEIVIAKAGRPRARLVAVRPQFRRSPGGWKGAVWMADDFDAPLPADLQRGFDGGAPPSRGGRAGRRVTRTAR